VLIVYPHTSNWDFIVGILAKWSIGIPVSLLGQGQLFQAAAVRPLAALARRRAGGPHRSHHGVVGAWRVDDL
jgi:hypothetical protein